MGRLQVARQGGLLRLMEPGPAITPKTRETAMTLVATLLLEAVTPAPVTEVTEARGMESDDEQDRV